ALDGLNDGRTEHNPGHRSSGMAVRNRGGEGVDVREHPRGSPPAIVRGFLFLWPNRVESFRLRVFFRRAQWNKRIDDTCNSDHQSASASDQGDSTSLSAGGRSHLPCFAASQDPADPWLSDHKSFHYLPHIWRWNECRWDYASTAALCSRSAAGSE